MAALKKEEGKESAKFHFENHVKQPEIKNKDGKVIKKTEAKKTEPEKTESLKKPKKEVPTAFRPILGRMQVLQNIMEQFGFFNDLSMDAIMGHLKACNAFAHGKDQVRDMARQITVECYRNFGDGVRCVCLFFIFFYNMGVWFL